MLVYSASVSQSPEEEIVGSDPSRDSKCQLHQSQNTKQPQRMEKILDEPPQYVMAAPEPP